MPRAPKTFRETVLLFAKLQGEEAPGDLFAKVDWSGASARQLTHAFLDRPPANGAEAAEPPGFDPAAAALALFQSGAFRDGLPARILRHFPGKQRLLFVHVPKSAGTDFAANLNRIYPPLSEQLCDPDFVPPAQLARRLRDFARLAGDAPCVFMAGHTRLSTYLDQGFFRFNDRLITIVRDPNEICVSFANYVVNRFAECPDLSEQDTRVWAHGLGLTAEEIARIEPRAFALALVTRPGLQPINPICNILGDGTAHGTLDNLRRAAIEITSTPQYAAWMRQTWNIERDGRINSSPQLIAWQDLAPWQQARIDADNAEDRIVFDAISLCLERSGALSVSGVDVAGACRAG